MYRPLILVASLDPQLADTRKTVLEGAGYNVISANNLGDIRKACQEHSLQLVLIGFSLPGAEKRRIYVEARSHCRTVPILELYEENGPALAEEGLVYSHRSETPDDLLDAVKAIVEAPAQNAKALGTQAGESR